MLIAPVKNIENGMALPAQANLLAKMGILPKEETAGKSIQAPDPAQLHGLAAAVMQNLKLMHNINLQFSVDAASGYTMITVKDDTNGKVIREIPSKEMLNLAAKMDEMIGLLFDRKG